MNYSFSNSLPSDDTANANNSGDQSVSCYESLFNKGFSLLYTNPDSARIYALQALECEGVENTTIHIRTLNLIGATHHFQSKFTQALDVYQVALEVAIANSDTTRISNIYNNIGITNVKLGNYSIALEYYLEALQHYSSAGFTNNTSRTLNNIGLLYLDLKNFEKAESYFLEALSGHMELNDSISIGNVFTNLGILYSNQNYYDTAFRYFGDAIGIYEGFGNYYGLSIVLTAKAKAFLELGDFGNAIAHYEQSISYAERINHPYQRAFALLGLAESYLQNDDDLKALQYAEMAYETAKEMNVQYLKMQVYNLFSLIHNHTGECNKAFDYFQKYVEIEKELINQTKLHQIYNLEIDYLNHTKAIQQLQIQRQELLISKKNNIIAFIVIAFILIFVGAYLFYLNLNHRREAAHQKDILNLTEKKSRAAIEAEFQERNRIGQELHDSLGQLLSVVRLNVTVMLQKLIMPEQRRKKLLESALHSVDVAFNELRNISHNLAPSVLAKKGLASALHELADQINQSNQIKVQLQIYGLNGSMANIIENTLYRAVQELLSNAIKHSGSNNLSIEIIKGREEVTLMVEDNGKGFNVDKALFITGGGFANIKSRVENLNGSIFIDSLENRGTIVTIIIPLKMSDYGKTTSPSSNN